MPITLRSIGTGSTNSGGGTQVVITTPPGTQPNDLMIAEIAVRGGTGTQITAPSGWTLVRRDNSGPNIAQAIYRRTVPGSPPEPISYTWTFNGGAKDSAGAIAAYIGASTATPLGVTGGQGNASSTSLTAPSLLIPSGQNADLLMGLYSIANSAAVTLPPGMTPRWSFRATGFGIALAASDLTLTSSGSTGNKVATAASAAANVGSLISLIPLTPGP
jgi:hypothetical protein